MDIVGIDYGSKLAGTTVLSFAERGRIRCLQAAGKQDADQFILEFCKTHRPREVFIDAPLSLPAAYRALPPAGDFFYREADRQLGAMSPMFLGGLTARAMKLKHQLEEDGHSLFEVYPGYLARRILFPDGSYKKEMAALPVLTEQLVRLLPHPADPAQVTTWHHFDSLLAYYSGFRYRQGEHLTFGNQQEGLIVV